MSLMVQAISSHPLLIYAVETILTDAKEFPYLASVSNEGEATRVTNLARLFLLDGYSLRADLGLIAERCRASSPGSKFISLEAPGANADGGIIRLLHYGIEGFVVLSETWMTELPQAIRSVLGGQYWVPPHILAAFFKQAQALEQAPPLGGSSLTAREGEVLRLLMRRLTNKEIARRLAISERTVKFHVSNILTKFDLEDRHGLHRLLLGMSLSGDLVIQFEQGARSTIETLRKSAGNGGCDFACPKRNPCPERK
jgi:DNA-binding NarL/FixJ family response regulator